MFSIVHVRIYGLVRISKFVQLGNLNISSPYGLARFLRTALSLSRTALPCQYRVHELMPTTEQIQNSKPSFESWCPPSESTGIPLHINELEPTMTQPEKIEIDLKFRFIDKHF